jgi:hemolysin III
LRGSHDATPFARKNGEEGLRRLDRHIALIVGQARARGADDDNIWANSDGQHGSPYYCSGRPRPLFRGVMHLGLAAATPIWAYYQLRLCHTRKETVAVALACFGASSMLGASGCYHRLDWRTERREHLASQLDHCGIYLQIAFSGAPLYLLLLPPPSDWAVIAVMASCAAVGCALALSPVELSRHFKTLVYCVLGLGQLLPLATSFFSPRSVISQLTPTEQALLALLALSYLVGSQIYANAWPTLWPSVFGFHELWYMKARSSLLKQAHRHSL